MAGNALVLDGYVQFMRATRNADREHKTAARKIFQDVGQSVLHDVQSFFSPISSKTAAGFKTKVRAREIVVEQTTRKTTGGHPEYGALQMRSLIRAQHTHEDELVRDLERAMDRVCDHFERTP